VKRDLEVFWPLLEQDGILIGDDMRNPQFPGVERAARVFALERGLDLWAGGNRFAVAKRGAERDGVPLGDKLQMQRVAEALPLPQPASRPQGDCDGGWNGG
jgi:hypothetical protein